MLNIFIFFLYKVFLILKNKIFKSLDFEKILLERKKKFLSPKVNSLSEFIHFFNVLTMYFFIIFFHNKIIKIYNTLDTDIFLSKYSLFLPY